MSNTDPLVHLKDIHLPTPVGLWPLAPGWYLMIATVIFLTIALSYFVFKKIRNAAPKKKALVLLENYRKNYEQEGNAPLSSALISELLRRVALAYFPREQVASLHGADWILFLKETSKDIDFDFVSIMLLDIPFRSNQGQDLQPLFKAAHLWIKQRNESCLN